MAEPLPPAPSGFRPPALQDPMPGRSDPLEQFDPNQTIDPTRDGISGLWFPDANEMYVSPRRSHHNDQLSVMDQSGQLESLGGTFVPWVWDLINIGDGPTRAELDFPRSAGGAFQYVSRNEIPQQYVRSGDAVDESDVYAVVWACRRLAVPGDSRADVAFLPSDSPYEPGTQRAVEFGVTRSDDHPISDWYQELQFAGQLPEPAFERPVDVEGE